MKRILILVLIVLFSSCNTYYYISNTEDIYLYNTPDKNDSSKEITLIPKGTYYYTTIVKKRFRKAKYGNLNGYIYNPYFDNPYYTPNSKVSVSNSSIKNNSTTNNSTYNYSSTSYDRPKTVNVKGYYRKNGTYVKPHTRSAPRRK
ncbi:hypothetical protein EOD40_07085 [Flavobacterium sufflavum]|uniref:Uncharacterized protein n=1 Tax=Flavobacterium sufflavum TaxID=1921138 RepID=A0A3S2U6W7_9FLAO|nr:hypothetical protein [Flavobacterium sufflavum]RVT77560.1 hypothetical protein EOD40_07085 [Flavobacterium sufflavum]